MASTHKHLWQKVVSLGDLMQAANLAMRGRRSLAPAAGFFAEWELECVNLAEELAERGAAKRLKERDDHTGWDAVTCANRRKSTNQTSALAESAPPCFWNRQPGGGFGDWHTHA